nr:VCBS repeat-containing protein [Acidobacteriota bacterium]
MRLLGSALAVLVVVVTLRAGQSQPTPSSVRDAREEAYRANNSGVAALERYDYKSAAAFFRDALRLDPSIAFARLNLAIALHYDGDPESALKEALAAAKALSREPRAWFVAGLAARAAANDVEALTAFEQVLKLDPSDVATRINIGQVHLENGRYAEAIDHLSKAAAVESFNATAAYGFATALLRARRTAEGQAAMARFQVLRDAPYAITYAAAYLQQGRYAEAIVSTGAEPQLVDARMPAVRFADVTAEALPGAQLGESTSVTLNDIDADGDVDLLVSGPSGTRLFRRAGASWRAVATPTSRGPTTGTIVADYDNDGRADVLVLGSRGVSLWHQLAGGAFEEATIKASLEEAAGGHTAAWGDLDHDGDVDFITAGEGAAQAWRNNGNGTFTRFPASTGLDVSAGAAAALVPTDFDAGRDIDVMIVGSGGAALLKNMREGRFENVAARSGFRKGAYQAMATADLDADGRPDFFFGRPGAVGLFVTSDGSASFKFTDAPTATTGALAAQLIDYDSDGVIDLVTFGAGGLRVLRNTGNAWADASTDARLPQEPCTGGCALASADVDDDGDIDLVTSGGGNVRVWRNEGPPTRTMTVRLSARVSNRSAIGARIDMRAGSLLRRFEASSATPSAGPADIVFGLGRRRADVVRVVWPSGIVQAENAPASRGQQRQRLDIVELDRKPSSCPYLFTWNGERFEFIGDFLGGGEMGYWLAPGVRNVPDPEEFVRIRGDQLKTRDGRYELRVTNELEEAVFVDRLSLIAVT